MKEYIKLFDVPQDGHLYKIDNIPFSCYVKNTGQNLECNKPNKKLRNVNEWLVIDDIVYPTENFVDLGLSVKWAKYNAGVNPTQLGNASDWYGNYYAWGETEQHEGWPTDVTSHPYDWTEYKYANGASNKLTKYCNDSQYGNDGFTDTLTVLYKTDDLFQVKYYEDWGNKYRMPTIEDINELVDTTKIESVWIKNYDPTKTNHNPSDDGGIQNLNGRLFISKIPGYIGRNIFIPAAGYLSESSYIENDSDCYLWCSSLNTVDTYLAVYLYFSIDYLGTNNLGNRCDGFSVRCVCEK